MLSWLYTFLVGQPLTVLNALTLVAAVPVTIIYRVAEGSYPLLASNGEAIEAPAATTIAKLRAFCEGVVGLVIGIARAGADLFDADKAAVYAALAFGGLIASDTTSALTWVGWGVGLIMALTGATSLFGFSEATRAVLKVLMP